MDYPVNKSFYQHRRIAIVGGSGTLGRALIKELYDTALITVIGRDEFKLHEIRRDFPNIYTVQADISIEQELEQALVGNRFVINCAANKDVWSCEKNHHKTYTTNVVGAKNLINVCDRLGVEKCLQVSTDKAHDSTVSGPASYYGKTKRWAEFLFQRVKSPTTFLISRSGNIWASRRSVITEFDRLASEGKPLPITDPTMTRFFISAQRCARFQLGVLEHGKAGDPIMTPTIYAGQLGEIVGARYPGHPTTIIGIQPGERLHEQLGTEFSNDPSLLKTYKELMLCL